MPCNRGSYFTAYLSETAVDSALEICVLIELVWSVLRPLRASLPRGALAVVAGVVVALGAAIWPFAVIPGFSNLPAKWHLLMHLQQTTSILRILFFLALAAGSQVLSIGWRKRAASSGSASATVAASKRLCSASRCHRHAAPGGGSGRGRL